MKHIDVHSFKQVLETEKNNSTVDFINVCTLVEYKEKHINGVRSVPLDELISHVSEFKNKQTVYIHCRSGNRGKKAIELLNSLGVKAELVNVEGGILAWDEAGFVTKSITTAKLSLMRQVMLGVGTIIILVYVFAYFLNP
jgi:rhodanese-related sulfurtransferase